MSKREQPPTRSAPVDDYIGVKSLLRHVRVMERVMEWIDENEKMRPFYVEIHCAYMDVLQEELAPHALTLALALAQLENAHPEIVRAYADASP